MIGKYSYVVLYYLKQKVVVQLVSRNHVQVELGVRRFLGALPIAPFRERNDSVDFPLHKPILRLYRFFPADLGGAIVAAGQRGRDTYKVILFYFSWAR